MACVRKPPDDCRRQHESLALCKSNGTPYQALGGDYCLRRQNPDAQARRLVKGVFAQLLGRDGIFTAVVEPKRDTALIGAIVLEDLDFLVDCKNSRLVPRDPSGPLTEIE